jgi:hypothetical protein
VITIMPALLRHIAFVQYSSALTKVNRITKLELVVYLIRGALRCGKSDDCVAYGISCGP